MTRVLAINGSYRDDGMTDRLAGAMVEALEAAGAQVDVCLLREYPIEFCLNCRECTQQSGDAPGHCVQQDGMQALVEKIEQADALILASPTNFGSVTALYKRFMERLVVYGYWPWGAIAPQFRKAGKQGKRAALVSSCAAPGLLGRWLYTTPRQLKMTAKIIGARPVGTLFSGMVAQQAHHELSQADSNKARALALKLL